MDIFLEISILLAIAAAIAGIMQLLRQPLIIGHIITGILVGPAVFDLVRSAETVDLFSHMGIALLLFIIGLGLNPRIIREVGKTAVLTGVGQIIFTVTLGFLATNMLGFSPVQALFVALGMAFSSTIIILKLLSDKKDTHRLYGKIAIGFLLVQDIVAVTALIFVTALSQDETLSVVLTQTFLAGLIFVLIIGLLSHYLLPRLGPFLARSQEYLFLFSLGWGFGVAAIADVSGFSIEIGALAAGVALANSPYAHEISSRMRPLRDFFIVLFFIVLGTKLDLASLGDNFLPAVALSGLVLVGNPIIVMSIMGLMGFTRKISFKAGLTVSQISEFSLILILLVQQNGYVGSDIVSMLTLVAMITIACSTYMITYSDKLYNVLAPYLKIFERSQARSEAEVDSEYDAILFGLKSGSRSFIETMEMMGVNYLVVDYDPEVVDMLRQEGVPAVFGDGNDAEFLEDLPIEKATLVVVTATDHATNNVVVSHVVHHNPDALILAKAEEPHEAQELYDMGATYVMMPHFLGSMEISRRLKRYGIDAHQHFQRAREHHRVYMNTSHK